MPLLPKDADLGWTPYAWLVYLGIFVFYPIVGQASTGEWVATAAAVAVFLALYFRGYWMRGRRVIPYIVAIAGLGAGFMPVNPGGSVFFVYAAGFCGRAGPPAYGWRLLAILLVVIGGEARLVDVPLHGWIPGLLFSALVGGVNIHYAEVGRRNARLKLAQEEIQQAATAAERERIARDLHDLLGHSLSIVTLKSQLVARLIETDARRARQEVQDVERISREAMAEVRRVVRGYRSHQLGVELANARMALASADVDLEVETSPYRLTPQQESALALALREAVTNVVKHARATRCRVALRQTRDEFRLVISDDGRGGSADEGAGLRGMAERIEALGGRVERDGAQGTRLTVTLPRRVVRSSAEISASGA
jgi:two-component system sensor histidine kinase DesK